MKKVLSVILLMSIISFNSCSLVFAEEQSSVSTPDIVNIDKSVDYAEKGEIVENAYNNQVPNILTTYKKLNKKEYKRTTIYKYYVPYEVIFKNTGDIPILMTTKTEVEFITDDDLILKSDSRRDIYRRTRKRDRGRHYALQVPGVIFGTCISLGTFLLGTPVGYGVYKAMQYPTIKAARTNVNISQDLYSVHGLPLRLEPHIEYAIYFYTPKNKDKKNTITLKSIRIKNVSLDNELKDIEVPLINVNQSQVNSVVVPENTEDQVNMSEENSDKNVAEEE